LRCSYFQEIGDSTWKEEIIKYRYVTGSLGTKPCSLLTGSRHTLTAKTLKLQNFGGLQKVFIKHQFFSFKAISEIILLRYTFESKKV